MDEVVIWQRLAGRWRDAADEVAEDTLKRCYRERAARYEQLAAKSAESEPARGPAKRLGRSR